MSHTSAPAPRTLDISPGIPLPLTTYVRLDYVPPGTFAGSRSMPSVGETLDTMSVAPRYSEFRLTQYNFAKTVKA